jgi:hypothetical protein
MSQQGERLHKVFMAPKGDFVDRVRAVVLAMEGEKPKKRARKKPVVTSTRSGRARGIA